MKRAKADSAPVDPDRVCNLAAAVLCGLCDAAATGRWLQQHLDAALLLVSCVPASSFATAAPYCCKLVTLLAPLHAAAGSSIAAAALPLAQSGAEEFVPHMLQCARCCIAAASDGKRPFPCPAVLFVFNPSLGALQVVATWFLLCNRGSPCMHQTFPPSSRLLQQLPVGAAACPSLKLPENRCALCAHAPRPPCFKSVQCTGVGSAAAAAAWAALCDCLQPVTK